MKRDPNMDMIGFISNEINNEKMTTQYVIMIITYEKVLSKLTHSILGNALQLIRNSRKYTLIIDG